MFVANKLRKENIAEYLLYMWQMEDLIRAYGCSLQRIKREYIAKFDYSEEEKEEEIDWFGDLIRMMNEEGKREKGHLQINEIVLKDIFDLHHQLLNSPNFAVYSSQYYKVLPYIVELRQKGQQDFGEIETCMNALYGYMMLHLQQKEISPDTQHAMEELSAFIGMLAEYYMKNEKEGLKFGGNE